LQDANFDNTPSGWTESTSSGYPIITNQSSLTTVTANTAPNVAWLGGYNNADDMLSQKITFPTTFVSGTLSFYYWIQSTVPSGTPDLFGVFLTDTSGNILQTLDAFSNQNATTGWTKATITVSGDLAGQQVDLLFFASTGASYNTNFFIDTASFTISMCPILDYSAGNDSGIGSSAATSYMGQTFTPTTNTINAIRVALSEKGTLGPITIQLRKVTGNTLLASWTIDVPANSSPTYYPYLLGLSTPLTVVPTDSYRIVFVPNASVSTTNETYWSFRTFTPPPYSGGDAQHANDSGVTWQNFSLLGSTFTGTFYFQTF
jgi:hypothetical protein